jgi:transposase
MAARVASRRPAIEAALLRVIANGTPRDLAGPAVGIDRTTLYRWLRASTTLRHAVEEAEAAAVNRRLERLDRAADSGTWQVDAWFLERRYPAHFGRRDRLDAQVEHSGTTTHTVKIDASPQAIATAISMAMAAMGHGEPKDQLVSQQSTVIDAPPRLPEPKHNGSGNGALLYSEE